MLVVKTFKKSFPIYRKLSVNREILFRTNIMVKATLFN